MAPSTPEGYAFPASFSALDLAQEEFDAYLLHALVIAAILMLICFQRRFDEKRDSWKPEDHDHWLMRAADRLREKFAANLPHQQFAQGEESPDATRMQLFEFMRV